MPTRNKTIAIILQSINEGIAYYERLYCSDLKELYVPITARYGRDEYHTYCINTRIISDQRDIISESIKLDIRNNLDLLRNESDRYPASCADECRKIEEWLLTH